MSQPRENDKTGRARFFYGQATDALADLYLRLDAPGAVEPLGELVRGHVQGPYCSIAKTLTTTTAFEHLPDAQVWRARIVDPCFWSPDYPALYRVTIQSSQGEWEARVGIRRFGCVGSSFRLNGKRWVIRAADREHVQDQPLSDWNDARMTMRVRHPDQALLDEAAERGIMLIVDVPSDTGWEPSRAMANCAAVALVIVPNQVDIQSLRASWRNIVIVKRYDPGNPMSWADADALLCHTDDELPTQVQDFGNRPVIAVRDTATRLDIRAARAACDRLQRDLAPQFDLSGYMI